MPFSSHISIMRKETAVQNSWCLDNGRFSWGKRIITDIKKIPSRTGNVRVIKTMILCCANVPIYFGWSVAILSYLRVFIQWNLLLALKLTVYAT
jgi:hypothetical protein